MVRGRSARADDAPSWFDEGQMEMSIFYLKPDILQSLHARFDPPQPPCRVAVFVIDRHFPSPTNGVAGAGTETQGQHNRNWGTRQFTVINNAPGPPEGHRMIFSAIAPVRILSRSASIAREKRGKGESRVGVMYRHPGYISMPHQIHYRRIRIPAGDWSYIQPESELRLAELLTGQIWNGLTTTNGTICKPSIESTGGSGALTQVDRTLVPCHRSFQARCSDPEDKQTGLASNGKVAFARLRSFRGPLSPRSVAVALGKVLNANQ
ncbi:hypothetical protein N7532_002858 [Penicillium argentinense]|uniref:Uncharacterized protein n=1 Tax=Penicillium argentinense TaxID=1131581 RepID=A0A9W9G185_9EURO|nr:uncharacterized protein N7532_002858 [Penicillium argentinense]KAJ5110213.1 hypothetical protein N7532_002858 [Penicillium argentinense]